MIKTLFAAMALTLAAGVAQACPQISMSGATINASATYLYTPRGYDVIAGGSSDVSRCGIRTGTGEFPVGWVAQAPDFELYYQKNASYALEFRVISNCDSVLLINTGGGNWYFDDDDNGNGDAKIRLTNPSAGLYDIWIGTYGPQTCSAQLQLETF